jgi:hypothetical protein
VHAILKEDLGMRRVYAKLVPRLLSDDQMDAGRPLQVICLGKVVTRDESWVFAYGPETKMQSSEWHTDSSPRPKKSRATKSNIKVMLVSFFDDEGIVHREFVPTGTSVTTAFYVDVLTRLRESFKRKRPQKWKNDWVLHHDNAPSHMAMAVQLFLAKNNIPIVPHLPYSPDLAPMTSGSSLR